MPDIRDWLAQYGNDAVTQLADIFPASDLDFETWSRTAMSEEDIPEEFVEFINRRMRQQQASKRLLNHPQIRQVTVLFVDLVGSTALGQKLGDERAIPLKNAFRRACRDAVEQFGGNVMYSHHDEVVACFGFPIAREREAERAVRAALQINRNLAQVDSTDRLQVRTGVSTARSIVGAVDPESPEMINAGMVVSHAARLSESANPSEIRISETTHALTSDIAIAIYCGEKELAGFASAQGSWRVISLAKDTGAISRRTELPLVGREAELNLLSQAWSRCCDEAQLQTIWVTGDAGIGKSRLIHELRYLLPMAQSAMVFSCSPYHSNSALYPVSRHTARSLGLTDKATDKERRDAIAGLLSSVDTQIEQADNYLDWLLGPAMAPDHPIARVPAEQRKQRLFELLRDIVASQAAQSPLLAIVEDIHWIDPTTLQLIRFLTKELPDQHFMIVLTARSGLILPEFADGADVVELQPLDPSMCAQLVEAVDSSVDLPPAVVDAIVTQCDGVPMYLEEVTRAHLAADEPLHAQAMTPRLNDLLIASLDSVGAARATAQLASVIGKSFSIGVLEAVSELPNELVHQHITALRDKGLFLERLEPEPSLSFRHALLRDCAYETLLEEEKCHYHGLVADSLIDIGHAPAEIIARHLGIADRRQESILKWQEAARTATRNGAYLEATAHLEAALALLPSPSSDKTVLQSRQELLLRMLPALLGSVSYGSRRVQKTMDEAIALSQQIGVDARIFPFFYGRWINTQAIGKHDQALKYSEEFIQLARQHGDAGATTAAHINAAWSTFNLADFYRSQALLTEADAAAKTIRRHSVGFAYAADAIIGLESCRVQTLWCIGDLDGCHAASARAIERSHEVKSGQSIFLAAQYAGAMAHALLGDWKTSLHYGRAMAEMEKIAGAVATGLFYASLAQMHLEQNTRLMNTALESEARISQMGFRYLMPFWLTSLAEVELTFGDNPSRASQLLARAQAIVDKTGERWFWVEHLRLQALIATRLQGGDEAANRLFDKACQLALQQQNASFGLKAAESAFQVYPETRFEQHRAHFLMAVKDAAG